MSYMPTSTLCSLPKVLFNSTTSVRTVSWYCLKLINLLLANFKSAGNMWVRPQSFNHTVDISLTHTVKRLSQKWTSSRQTRMKRTTMRNKTTFSSMTICFWLKSRKGTSTSNKNNSRKIARNSRWWEWISTVTLLKILDLMIPRTILLPETSPSTSRVNSSNIHSSRAPFPIKTKLRVSGRKSWTNYRRMETSFWRMTGSRLTMDCLIYRSKSWSIETRRVTSLNNRTQTGLSWEAPTRSKKKSISITKFRSSRIRFYELCTTNKNSMLAAF